MRQIKRSWRVQGFPCSGNIFSTRIPDRIRVTCNATLDPGYFLIPPPVVFPPEYSISAMKYRVCLIYIALSLRKMEVFNNRCPVVWAGRGDGGEIFFFGMHGWDAMKCHRGWDNGS